jgi:hemerythrin
MPILSWSDQFSIGIPQVDAHHQHLFHLFNRLYNDFINKTLSSEMNNHLDELIDYATYHFAAEEHWMKVNRFPNLKSQEQEHALFSRKVAEMAKSYETGEKHLALETLSFLHNWLSTHILQSDVQFGRFIATHNNGILQTKE